MTKSELVAHILQKHPVVSRRQADGLVRLIFDGMADSLARGERIEIRGFGSFHVKERGPRSGRNPKTGAAVEVGEKRVACFKVGKELRQRVDAIPSHAPA